jgi:hypothetical protein
MSSCENNVPIIVANHSAFFLINIGKSSEKLGAHDSLGAPVALKIPTSLCVVKGSLLFY